MKGGTRLKILHGSGNLGARFTNLAPRTSSAIRSLWRRDYVTGPDGGGLNQADTTVMISVTHQSLKTKFVELRLDLHVSFLGWGRASGDG